MNTQESWRELGACRDHDPAPFFSGGEAGPTAAALAAVQQICGSCPVKEECLEYAVDTAPRYGIWGGLTTVEISAIRRRRRFKRAS